MTEPQTATAQPAQTMPVAETIDFNADSPAAAAWKRAEAAADAAIAAGQVAPVADPPEPAEAPAEPEATEAAEAEPQAEATEEPAETEAATEESTEPAKTDPAEGGDVKTFHELAAKLGFKVDGRAVSKDERVGFRQEKRQFHEKARAQEQAFQERLAKTQQFFEPFGEAYQALQSGDIDGAVKALGKAAKDEELSEGGLNAATKRVLKRAAGEDPRIDELTRKLAQREREDAERARRDQEQQAQAEQQRQRQSLIERTATEFQKHTDPMLARGATKPAFVEQVIAEMEQHWDGFETLSAEDAAANVLARYRSARDEINQILGDRDAKTPESPTQETAPVAGQPSTQAVGKKPKPHSGRHATEASPQFRAQTDQQLRSKWTEQLRQARD